MARVPDTTRNSAVNILCSPRRLRLDDPVALADAQAYPCLGRQTRKVDLRGYLARWCLIR